MAIIKRQPGRWATLNVPPTSPTPRLLYKYAVNGAWAEGKRVGFREIAAKYTIPEVWDLIAYNFQLRNPAEVNWALNHFLGCTKTLDGKNYCLDRNDRNPTIAIPPLGFKAFTPADERVRERIIESLQDAAIDMVRFRIGPLTVDTALFGRVIDAVRCRSILALDMDGTAPAGVRAMYSPALNFFWIREPGSFDMGKRATVVHEAVHAGMDIAKHAGNLLLHEAVAHVAEAIRMAMALPDPRSVHVPGIPSRQGRGAMRLAQRFIAHNQASPDLLTVPLDHPDYVELRDALKAIPEYGARAGDDIGSNGI